MIKVGTKWTSNNDKIFHVIDLVEVDGHTWVHYILEDATNPKEYSCYLESFIERFRPLPE